MQIHLKRHNFEKNFFCSECSLAFVSSCELKEHSQVHLKQQFECICDKGFPRMNDLNKHIKMNHQLL